MRPTSAALKEAFPSPTRDLVEASLPMSVTYRPIVRSFKRKYTKEAAAHVRAGGHAIVWENDNARSPPLPDAAEGRAGGLRRVGRLRHGQVELAHARARHASRASRPRSSRAIACGSRSGAPSATRFIPVPRARSTSIARSARRAAVTTRSSSRTRTSSASRTRDAASSRRRRSPSATRTVASCSRCLPNKRCRHLKRDNRCGIYELRPHPCSEFPRAASAASSRARTSSASTTA